MTKVELQRTDEGFPGPGEWSPLRRPGEDVSAMVACPDCGELASLTNHDIDPTGEVTPSLVCGNDDCSFHAYVTLGGRGE